MDVLLATHWPTLKWLFFMLCEFHLNYKIYFYMPKDKLDGPGERVKGWNLQLQIWGEVLGMAL